MKARFSLLLIAAQLGWPSAAFSQSTAPATDPVPPAANHGLICEAVPAQETLEQGMPLEIKIYFIANPAELPPGLKHLNAFWIHNHLTLHLTNRATKKIHTLDLEDFRTPQPIDNLSQVKPLDGRLGPWTKGFRLVRLHEELVPGNYDCAVEFAYPDRPHVYWRTSGRTDEEWKEFAFWHGRVLSSPFHLEILPESRKFKTFLVPKDPVLKEMPDGSYQLVFKREAVTPVRREVHNGLVIFEQIEFAGSRGFSRVSDWGKTDIIKQIPPGTKQVKFRAAVFETDLSTGFIPIKLSGKHYRVLWQMTYETNLVSIPKRNPGIDTREWLYEAP